MLDQSEPKPVASGDVRRRSAVPGSVPAPASGAPAKIETGAAGSGRERDPSSFDLPPAPPLRRRPLRKALAGYVTFAVVSLFSAYFFVTVGFSLLIAEIKKRREAAGGRGATGARKAPRSRAEAVAAEPGIAGVQVTHEFFDVPALPDESDGRTTTVHVARAGVDPSRRVVLLLHGFPECWLSWRDLMARLVSAGYEVAAMDMRGYNLSGKPGVDGSRAPLLPASTAALKSYDLGALSADARAVAARLSGPSGRLVTLVSHDWGGAVAWAAASVDSAAARGDFGRQTRRLFDALCTLAIPHPECFQRNMTWAQAKRSWYIAFFQSPFVPELFMAGGNAAAIRNMLPRRSEEEEKEADEIADAFTVDGAATASINYYRASVRAVAAGPLSPSDARAKRALKGGVDVPVLVLYAKRDSALGEELLAGTERYCHASVEVHRLDSGHWVQLERREEVAERTLAFLERTGGNGARFA